MTRRSSSIPAAVIAFLLFAVGIARLRADDTPMEYQVKAAFLLHFTKFVEWPAEAFEDQHSPFRICVLGEDPFGEVLNRMVKGEGMNGRKLEVERIRRPPEGKTCQVLFVSQPAKDIAKTLAPIGRGVLTVGEGDDFLRDGGVIAFVIENRRVRFDINQKAATSASLTISSRLLSVARMVAR